MYRFGNLGVGVGLVFFINIVYDLFVEFVFFVFIVLDFVRVEYWIFREILFLLGDIVMFLLNFRFFMFED